MLDIAVGTGGLAIVRSSDLAPEAIGAALLLLLLVSIRNAWDVATFAIRTARAQPMERDEK